MTPPPRALLLTDVVDSTRLSHDLGDAAMACLWTEHDRAARDLLRAWRGREIEKTDGLLALFDTAADAVGFAIGYHRALAGLGVPLRARVGIHAGALTLRETSADDAELGAKRVEVDGLVKPITARVMATALGGQTLLTGAAREALGATALRVLPHGHWRLKGVPEPIELFEIGEAGAPFTPPPDDAKAWRVVRQRDLWLPMREVRHSLPAERDHFVGRHEPLQMLARKLEDGARLVSVLGIGGTGKTRFVTRFAWTWLGEYPGGVWFCDLSQARTVDGIHFAVAQGLDVPLGKTDPVVQLGRAIAGRGRCLVVFDNFEQVARHAEETLGHWLERAPEAQFIVTTREVLGIVGEETMGLEPLPGADAATLFLRRAKAARSDFEPNAADLAAIAQLVKVLDGLPLAIELAAARVRVMSPAALVGRMGERFEVLLSKAGRNNRQATLRAAFDWSWELLSEPEKAALAQLAVFESGFTLASAQAVLASANGERGSPAADLLQWLVEKSFVRQLADERFDLLESVRDYADEHLRTAGRFAGSGPAAAEAAKRRHWQFFAAIEEAAATADRGVELGNLVMATRRAVGAGDAGCAVAALVRAWAVFKLTGPFSAAATLADGVAEKCELSTGQGAWVAWIAGCALELKGDTVAARSRLDHGLSLARSAGDEPCEVLLLIAISSRQSSEGSHEEALAGLVRARTLAVELRRPLLECLVLNGLGRLFEHQGRPDIARGHLEAALALARQTCDLRLEGGLLGNLGGVHQDQGRLELACHHYELALALATQVGDRQWEGNARCNLGLTLHELGRGALAAERLHEALSVAREIGHLRLECTVLCNLGIVAGAYPLEGQPAQAYFAAAIPIGEEIGDLRLTGQIKGYQGLDLARHAQFDSARACFESGESLLRRAADPWSLALLVAHRGEAALLEGDTGAARHSQQAAAQLVGDAPIDEASELGRALARLRMWVPATVD